MAKLLRNSIQTPDGTILTSHNRHDYQSYVDANGSTYVVDGGLDYERGSANGDELSLHVYDDEPHDIARDVVSWGTRGKDGDQPFTWKPVAEMDTDHLTAVLTTQNHIYPQVKKVMLDELEMRGVEFDEEEAAALRHKAERAHVANFIDMMTKHMERKV